MTIGVDLGATQIRAAVCQGDQLTDKRQTYLENKEVLEKTLDQITEFIAPLVQTNTSGIGIGVPAIVDIPAGVVYNSNNIASWERVELKKALEMRLSLPVHINNDANCFTYGAYKYELGERYKHVVGMTLGTGVGLGVVLNGSPYFGSNCGAGELGLNPYLDMTYEHYTSSDFFLRTYNVSAQEANELARQGSEKHQAIWADFGHHLGQFVKTVVAAYDPEAIAFGGSITQAYDLFEGGLRSALLDFQFPESIKRLQLVNINKSDVAILGAAALFEDYESMLVNA